VKKRSHAQIIAQKSTGVNMILKITELLFVF